MPVYSMKPLSQALIPWSNLIDSMWEPDRTLFMWELRKTLSQIVGHEVLIEGITYETIRKVQCRR